MKKFFDTKPNYLVEENEIINNKPKSIEIMQNTSSPNKSKKIKHLTKILIMKIKVI